MTKRVRGPVRAHKRPGTRPPTERPAGARRREWSAQRPDQFEVAQEIAEDAVESNPAETPAPEAVRRTSRTTTRTAPPATSSRIHHKIKAGSLLATRAATEYVYVAQDMRRITVVAALLIGSLFLLWLLVVILKVIPLPFY